MENKDCVAETEVLYLLHPNWNRCVWRSSAEEQRQKVEKFWKNELVVHGTGKQRRDRKKTEHKENSETKHTNIKITQNLNTHRLFRVSDSEKASDRNFLGTHLLWGVKYSTGESPEVPSAQATLTVNYRQKRVLHFCECRSRTNHILGPKKH